MLSNHLNKRHTSHASGSHPECRCASAGTCHPKASHVAGGSSSDGPTLAGHASVLSNEADLHMTRAEPAQMPVHDQKHCHQLVHHRASWTAHLAAALPAGGSSICQLLQDGGASSTLSLQHRHDQLVTNKDQPAGIPSTLPTLQGSGPALLHGQEPGCSEQQVRAVLPLAMHAARDSSVPGLAAILRPLTGRPSTAAALEVFACTPNPEQMATSHIRNEPGSFHGVPVCTKSYQVACVHRCNAGMQPADPEVVLPDPEAAHPAEQQRNANEFVNQGLRIKKPSMRAHPGLSGLPQVSGQHVSGRDLDHQEQCPLRSPEPGVMRRHEVQIMDLTDRPEGPDAPNKQRRLKQHEIDRQRPDRDRHRQWLYGSFRRRKLNHGSQQERQLHHKLRQRTSGQVGLGVSPPPGPAVKQQRDIAGLDHLQQPADGMQSPWPGSHQQQPHAEGESQAEPPSRRAPNETEVDAVSEHAAATSPRLQLQQEPLQQHAGGIHSPRPGSHQQQQHAEGSEPHTRHAPREAEGSTAGSHAAATSPCLQLQQEPLQQHADGNQSHWPASHQHAEGSEPPCRQESREVEGSIAGGHAEATRPPLQMLQQPLQPMPPSPCQRAEAPADAGLTLTPPKQQHVPAWEHADLFLSPPSVLKGFLKPTACFQGLAGEAWPTQLH